MSEYDRLAKEATPRPWVVDLLAGRVFQPPSKGRAGRIVADGGSNHHDANLIVALANNADNFRALWEAAEATKPCNECPGKKHAIEYCLADQNIRLGADCYVMPLRAAVEALRPLFGGDGE